MRILIINLKYLGDLLFTTPAIRVLHNAYPGAVIDMMVNDSSYQIVQHHPLLNEVYPIAAPKRMEPLAVFWRNIRLIRSRKYDLAICFNHSNERTTILTALSGAKKRGGFVKPALRFLYPDTAVTSLPGVHAADQCLQILHKMGVPEAPHNNLEIWTSPAAQATADQLWRDAGLEGKTRVIGLNTGASFPTKQWTIAGFAQLNDKLTADGYTPVFFGGLMDVEFVDAVCALTMHHPITFTGKVDILVLTALIKKCSSFITSDTGPMHIAAAHKIPIVALFGPTPWDMFGPYGTLHVIISADIPCMGCMKHFCADLKCMESITTEMIYHGLMKLEREGGNSSIDIAPPSRQSPPTSGIVKAYE